MTDARELTKACGGKWFGPYGTAACPVCQPEGRKDQNALTLADGSQGLLAHCKRSECAFRDILSAAGLTRGSHTPPDPATMAEREREQRAATKRRAASAMRLWQEAQPIAGTIAETYLRGRGITCDLPPSLRFHGNTWHGPTGRRFPALVALVEGSDGFAVHRTYLRPDGSGKADVEPVKAMLGTTAGGAVRLSDGPTQLVVAEGIESAISLNCGLLRKPATVWAALSTSGMRNLRLPQEPGYLTIAIDGDEPGRDAGYALAERASLLGWQVSLLPAPDGRDWNDILLNTRGPYEYA